MVSDVLHDLRYGCRMLIRSPGFTIAAVLTLALGIGANTAIFSLVNGVLLRPLPFPEPDRLIWLQEHDPGAVIERPAVSYLNFLDWRDQNSVFTHVAVVDDVGFNVGGESPERVEGMRASADLFTLLRVEPALGRAFTAEEDRPGGEKVVVLAHGLWKRLFGADRGVLGRTIRLNDEPHTVVGVLPPDFTLLPGIDVWVPLAVDPVLTERGHHWLSAVARLKPGVSPADAQADMTAIARRLEQDYPQSNANHGVLVMPLQGALVEDIAPPLFVLMGAVGFVLLIASANVANLLLARSAARQREIAIRASLGAGRGRIVRQLLTESLLLSLLGGGAGLLLGTWLRDTLASLIPADVSLAEMVRMDGRVLAFTVGTTLLTGILFGMAPAFQASRGAVSEALKEGGWSATAGPARHRLRSALVVSEVALASILLVGAGLMIRSFHRLRGVDPGLDPENVLTLRVSLPEAKYRERAQVAGFFDATLKRVAALPGAAAAGAILRLPLTGRGGWDWGFTVEGRPSAPPGQNHGLSNFQVVTPDYFRAMGVRILKGRVFGERDRDGAPGVVLVNETLARAFWPTEDPVGKRLRLGGEDPNVPWLTIVGVVNDVRYRGLDAAIRQDLYLPSAQAPQREMSMVVRTASEPMGLAAAVRAAVLSVDADLPIYRVRGMREVVDASLGQQRFPLQILAAFALLALVLAAVGIYGVMSYAVTQRTHEIGVRMALGAGRAEVLRMVVGQGLRLAIMGVAVGLAGSLALTRLLSSLLFGVSATDPATFVGVPVLLAAVAALACYIPARRATRVDPMVALRCE